MVELSPALQKFFSGDQAFDQILALDGEIFRQVCGRRTLRFEVGGHRYFLKAHAGVGWREIFKNLFSFRLPVLGAGNELRAIKKLHQLNVATMTVAGYGERGFCPASRQSFLITEELASTISLEDFCRDWLTRPPAYSLRKALIEKIAEIAHTLHGNGVNHRDLYLCHFLLELPLPETVNSSGQLRIFLIDLHRVQMRSVAPERWVVKDVAGIYFSSLDIGLTRRDVFRFMRRYSGRPVRETLQADRAFWLKVRRRAEGLYLRDFGRQPEMPL